MKLSPRALTVTAIAVSLAAAGAPAAVASSTAAAPSTLTQYAQRRTGLISVQPGTQLRATLLCPAGSLAVGGGVLFQGSALTAGLTSSNPELRGHRWAVRVTNTGTTAAQFKINAVCVAGVRDYEIIEGIGVDNPAGTQATSEAFCPNGTVPLGGGFNSISPSTAVNANSSRPLGNAWRTTALNTGTDDNFVQAYAVCGAQPDSWQQITGTTAGLKPAGQGQAVAGCPVGTRVLSGGAQASFTPQSTFEESSAPGSTLTWQVFQNNPDDQTGKLTAYATCAKAALA